MNRANYKNLIMPISHHLVNKLFVPEPISQMFLPGTARQKRKWGLSKNSLKE